jgi:hypothetical protein
MKKLSKNVVNGHEWHRSGLLRPLAAVLTLLSLVLASGASTQWGDLSHIFHAFI